MRLAALFWALLSCGASVAEPLAKVHLGDFTARFEAPTERYGHAIMGDLPQWGGLCLSGPKAQACVTLPQSTVFEDIAPPVWPTSIMTASQRS